jgi:hypothetical protein
MKQFIVLISSFILFHTVVHCQSKYREIPPPKMSLGIEAAFPVGNMSLINSFGAGISIKTILPFTPFCGFSFSGGGIKYFNKNNFGIKEKTGFFCIPMKAGISFFTRNGIYIEPQVGYSLLSSKYAEEGAFCYAANIGCAVTHHFDLSFNYETMTKHGFNLSHTGVRVAYIF